MSKDTYGEVRIFNFSNMEARVHFPVLTTEERNKRMKEIYKAAERLLKGANEKCNYTYLFF